MNSSEALDLLTEVKRIACEAAAAIRQIYNAQNYQVQHKADASPVTDADLMAHEIITNRLQKLGGPSLIISEEQSAESHAQITSSRESMFWLVDPLDGTKEFIRRNGEFTVNIALIADRSPILGVVCQPTTEVIYSGIVGAGAWKQIEPRGPALAISVRTRARPPISLISRSHRQIEEQLVRNVWADTQFEHLGSSLKFCRVAEGQADVYLRTGETKEWDSAAGHAVLFAAGGCVLDPATGAELLYRKPELLNRGFIATGERDSALPFIRKS